LASGHSALSLSQEIQEMRKIANIKKNIGRGIKKSDEKILLQKDVNLSKNRAMAKMKKYNDNLQFVKLD
jgi:hypothetical protein